MKMRLKRLRIRNFKAIQRLDLHFPSKILILIGKNGSGKSSVLQATAFIQYLIKGQPEQFFTDRGWSISDIRSKRDGLSKLFGFNIHLETEKERSIYWTFNWSPIRRELENESIWEMEKNGNNPRRILHYTRPSKSIAFTDRNIKGVKTSGSILSIIETDALSPEISAILKGVIGWANGIFSLELLSPTAMRGGNRGIITNIGPRGERLGGFIASLSSDRRARLIARLASFYPLKNIETTKKRAGWIDLKIAEGYPGLGSISVAHMSDGFMRLLGIASIPEFDQVASMVLLDEIEDGIEPHILSEFVQLISKESSVQMLMTSHSPILVNSFEPNEICFIARTDEGSTIAAGYHEIEGMNEGLEYFGTGELWSHTGIDSITEMVREVSAQNEARIENAISQKIPLADRIKQFLETKS